MNHAADVLSSLSSSKKVLVMSLIPVVIEHKLSVENDKEGKVLRKHICVSM